MWCHARTARRNTYIATISPPRLELPFPSPSYEPLKHTTMLALYSNLELGITLIAPYVEHATLRALALVSRDVAEVVFPFLFHTLKPVTTSQWGTSEALISLLAGPDRPWRHACFVR